MKRSLIVASCVLLVSSLFTSCQKEDKSIVELTQELTAELQKITDLPSANSLAGRVAVLNKRFQDASVRVFALNGTSLVRGADGDDHEGASYSAALKDLAREIGRVRASFPCASADGKVDRDRLLAAIGAANGETDPAKYKEAGLRYMQDETGAHETPGTFPEYYGSAKLREALAYRASVSDVSLFKIDSAADVPALPAPDAVSEAPVSAGDDDDSAADSSEEPAATTDSGSAADKDDDDSSTPSAADDGDDDDDSDSGDDDSSSAADDLEIDF